MSEHATAYLHSAIVLTKEIELLRSQIAMYLKSGIGDLQGQGLLNKAEILLRQANAELKQHG